MAEFRLLNFNAMSDAELKHYVRAATGWTFAADREWFLKSKNFLGYGYDSFRYDRQWAIDFLTKRMPRISET